MQCGNMRTRIRIQQPAVTGTGINEQTSWVDLGNASASDDPRYVSCEWIPKIGGTRIELSDSTQTLNYATLTVRYNSAINPACRILNDGTEYDMLSVTDPDQHKLWMEITVRAAVSG